MAEDHNTKQQQKEEQQQIFLDLGSEKIKVCPRNNGGIVVQSDIDHRWVPMAMDVGEVLHGDVSESRSMESSSYPSSLDEEEEEVSANSLGSSTTTSSDLAEDAISSLGSSSSSSSSSTTLKLSSSHANGPLYELSDLMAELPIKRGLSKFYQGKSQSYASLASVKTVEDLPKKENPYKLMRMKACKSYAGGLDRQNNNYKPYGPKATIAKKASSSSSRGGISSSSFLLSSLGSRRGSLLGR